MVLCQIPTISPFNPGDGEVGDPIDRCITLHVKAMETIILTLALRTKNCVLIIVYSNCAGA